MTDSKKTPIYEGVIPQIENIRGVTPQHQSGGTSIHGGVQPQHTETGQNIEVKPPASK
ncbi:MAG TPA: hypothetical protein HPP97_13775 [Desulfuromonadales bacterium]|nr:hypothetical protein [Desulfuromonadales bacterium]